MSGYRTATLSELSVVLGWAADEGWNPGLDDADAFYAADPQGFFVKTDREKPVGAISVVNHTVGFAFLGLYIVAPQWRGQGVGFGLWQHAISHAGERTIGLDGVPAQQANYEASGFVRASSNIRYTGRIEGWSDEDTRDAQTVDIATLVDVEAAQSGAHKAGYLTAWFQNTPNRRTLILENAGAVAGFCTVRKCFNGAKVGPLWTRTAAQAERLMRHAATVFGPVVSIDVSADSQGLTQLCKDLGLTPGFDTARMYRGPFDPPQTDFFAVTSLELG
ncbi:MAG: GNAT family N-acetyltransferase [Pseudomonadota bacterium]